MTGMGNTESVYIKRGTGANKQNKQKQQQQKPKKHIAWSKNKLNQKLTGASVTSNDPRLTHNSSSKFFSRAKREQ